jgi:hypothetical protein
MENDNSSEAKTVLISYSHDDTDHKDWVRSLADKLLRDGIDIILDQYDLLPGASLTRFMEDMVLRYPTGYPVLRIANMSNNFVSKRVHAKISSTTYV